MCLKLNNFFFFPGEWHSCLGYQGTLEELTVVAVSLHELPEIETNPPYGAVCSYIV
jgi:hypothetical protein